jgi:hypothetical protein
MRSIHSSASVALQMRMSSSIAIRLELLRGATQVPHSERTVNSGRNAPASCCHPGLPEPVRTQRLSARSGFSSPASAASAAVRISISGAILRKPRMMRPSRSASAWNRIRMARTLQLRNQLRVGSPRLLMQQLGIALSRNKVGIDLTLVAQVKRQCAVNLFESQCWIGFHRALCGHPFAKEVNKRVEGNPGISDPIGAIRFLYVFPLRRPSLALSYREPKRHRPQHAAFHPRVIRHGAEDLAELGVAGGFKHVRLRLLG